MDDALRARIQELITKNDVVLFMKGNKNFPQCGFSSAVVGILKELEVPFETVNVLSDPTIRDGIKQFSDWPTIPQLYIKGEFVGGSDIIREMHSKGELQQMLGKEQKPVEPPNVILTDTAMQAFRGAAGEADADDALRLTIDARFQNDLYFGPKEPDDIIITANGITIAMDAATAKRANGLKIDFVQGPGGAGFKIDNPNEPPRVKGVGPEDVKQMLASGEKLQFIDVRTEKERAIAKVDAARLLDEAYAGELEALPKDSKLVFMCHHGVRSQNAAQQFLDRGFTNVWNVVGGIDAWSAMDPSVPRY
jgi:monothiol glutaredoxin